MIETSSSAMPDARSTTIVSTPEANGQESSGDPGNGAPDANRSVEHPEPLPVAAENENSGPVEEPNIERLIQLLPPEERARMVAVVRRESMSHTGWLPTPQFMREYDDLLPGLAERIVAMPEREQAFRHRATETIVQRDYKLRATGQLMGMIALVLLLAFCVFLAIWGAATAAATVAGTVIVGTVGVFVTGQIVDNKSSSKDLVETDD